MNKYQNFNYNELKQTVDEKVDQLAQYLRELWNDQNKEFIINILQKITKMISGFIKVASEVLIDMLNWIDEFLESCKPIHNDDINQQQNEK